MTSTKTLLLAGTALLLLGAAPVAPAAAAPAGVRLAQASPPPRDEEKKPPAKGHEQHPPQHPAPPAHAAPPHPEPQHAPPPHAQPKPPAPPQHQAQPKPPEKPAAPPHEAPKAAQQPPQPPRHEPPKAAPPAPHQAEPRRDERHQPRENGRHETVTPNHAAPPAAEHRPGAAPPPAAATPAHPPAATPPQKPAAETPPAAAPQKPAAQTPPPAAAQKPATQAAPNAPAGTPPTNAPAQKPAAQTAPPAPPPPQKPQSAQQFILPKNGKPTVTIQDLRRDRHETREGNRTVITEGNRTIVKEDNRTFIRHNETQRFAVGARGVNVERHGNETTTVIVRPDGDRIINVTDDNGHLIRRIRRERDGREVVIIDERDMGPRRDIFVDVPPPVIRIPRDRYIVELDRARPDVVYEVLDAPPVERIERTYSIGQIRYNTNVRQLMPRLDLDINFDTGSWQLTPDQIDKLSVVAQGLNRAIDRNPREVFLIEGHTDAVGSAEDNLSLSDRRAESVAVALTEQFHVPPENLVTQGYGEQDLKVQTQGPSRANRRVSIRRITPLIDRQARR